MSRHDHPFQTMTYDLSRHLRRHIAALMLLSMALPAAAQRLAVTDQGTASYDVPIVVPPGAGGLTPKISIDYTAAAQNGTVGFGWSLSGISMISRCRATIATDGQPGGIKWRASDKLCLDGKRLIALDTATGQPMVGRDRLDAAGMTGATTFHEFRLENDDYSRIRAYGVADTSATPNLNAGPLFFRVWTKDGRIIDYGNNPATTDGTTKADIVGAASSSIGYPYAQSWLVSRIADVSGNHVDYKYQQQDREWGSKTTYQTGHEWWLAEIQYSGNKVLFNYEDRTTTGDASEGYNYGAKNLSIKRLTSVTTYVNAPAAAPGAGSGTAVQTLKLSYIQSQRTKRSLLYSATQCAGDATSTKCMPSTTFGYTGGGGSDQYVQNTRYNLGAVPMPTYSGQNIPSIAALTSDFDGDGRTDILRMTYSGSTLYTSDGTGNFIENAHYNITEPLISDYRCYLTLMADFNGDGMPDLLRVSRTKGWDPSFNVHICNNTYPTKIFFNNGDGSFRAVTVSGADIQIATGTVSTSSTTFTVGVEPYQLFVLDVDGDGIADLVDTKYPTGTFPYASANPPSPCATITCTWVYKGNGDGSFTSIPTNLEHTSIFASGNPGENVLDMDGDGLQDIFITNGFGMIPFAIARSLGDGNFEPVGKPLYHMYLPFDYKGDGRVSLMNYDPSALGPYSYDPNSIMDCPIWIADQADTSLSMITNSNICHGGDSELADSKHPSNVGVLLQDFNGDGRQDILRWNHSAASNGLFLSNGDGTFTTSTTFGFQGAAGGQIVLGGVEPTGTNGMLTGDFTGHGNLEFIATAVYNGTPGSSLWVKGDQTPSDLLYSVYRNNGENDTVSYAPASSNMVYASERNPAAPATGQYIDATTSQILVDTLMEDVGGAVPLLTQFSYQGLKADRKGRGVLGFHVTTRQSKAPDGSTIVEQTEHAIEFPYTGMSLSVSRSYQGGTGFDGVTTVYCDQSASASAVATALSTYKSCPADTSVVLKRPYALLTLAQGHDLSGVALPTKTTQATIWNDGEPSVVAETLVGPAGASDTFKTIRNLAYFDDVTSCQADQQTCKWILARKKTETVEKIVPSTIATTVAGSAPNASATSGPTTPHALLTAAASQTFPAAWQGAAATMLTWTYQNDGVGLMTLSSPTLAAPLRVASNSCSNVAAGASCAIVIADDNNVAGLNQAQTFAPTGTTNTPAPATASYSVKTSIPRWSQTSLAFGGVKIGASSSATVSLYNDGNTAQNWSGFTVAAPLGVNMSGCASVAAGASCPVTLTFTPTSNASWTSPALQPGNAYPGAANTLTASGSGTTPPSATTALNWGGQILGSASTQTATFTNLATVAAAMTVPSASSVSGAGFAFQGTTCAATLAANSACTVTLSFTPTALTSYSGTLSLSSSQGTAATALSGSGAQSQLAFSPTSFAFGDIPANSAAQTTLTLSNTGNVATTPAIVRTGIGAVGGCSGISLAAGASCPLNLIVSSTTLGSYTGTVTASSANGPVLNSVSWTANIVAPNVTITPSLTFGSITVGQTSASQTVTLTNASTAPVTVTAPVNNATNVSGPYSLVGTTCGGALAAGGACTMTVQFSPNAGGSNPGVLKIWDGWAWHSTSLSGTGAVAPPTATSTLSWGGQKLNTATTRTATFNNVSALAASMTVPSAASVSASGFIFQSTTCGATLPANSSCTVTLAFTPTALNSYSGTLTITSSLGSTTTSLSGAGVQAQLVFSPATYDFGNVASNVWAQKSFTLTNTGNTGANFAVGIIGGGSISGCDVPLGIGASCTMTVGVHSYTLGPFSGGVTVDSTDGPTLNSFNWTANSVAPAITATSSINFGNVTVGQASAVQMVTLTNGSAGSINVTKPVNGPPTVSTPFALTATTCGGVLTAGSSCTLSFQYVPTTTGQVWNSFGLVTDYAELGGTLGGFGVAPAVAPFTVVSSTTNSTLNTTTFKNPNSMAVTPSSSGISLDNGDGFGRVSSNTCTGSIAANGTCTIAIYVAPPDCKADNYSAHSFVTDAGGTAAGATVYGTTSKTICN